MTYELEEEPKRLEVEAWELEERLCLPNEMSRDCRDFRFRSSDLEHLVHDLAEEAMTCRFNIANIRTEGTQFGRFVADMVIKEHNELTEFMSEWPEIRNTLHQNVEDFESSLKDTERRMQSRIMEFIGTAANDNSLVHQKLLEMEQEILNLNNELIQLMRKVSESYVEKCEEWLITRLKVPEELRSERDNANERVNTLEIENAKMAQDMQDEKVNSNKMIVIILSICGAILVVFGITSIGIYHKIK